MSCRSRTYCITSAIHFTGGFHAKPLYAPGVVDLFTNVNEGLTRHTPIVQAVAPNPVVVFFYDQYFKTEPFHGYTHAESGRSGTNNKYVVVFHVVVDWAAYLFFLKSSNVPFMVVTNLLCWNIGLSFLSSTLHRKVMA